MARDRASPFSRKHRRYWLTVTGGMILIMAVNVGLGVWLYDTSPRKLPTVVQPPAIDGGVDAAPLLDGVPIDAGPDAAATASP
jgi:hypothetical protein